MTIAVSAASGQLGRIAVTHLKTLVDPSQVVALARDPAKLADLGVTARPFDYTRPDMLIAGLDGVETLALISSGDLAGRVDQHRNVIEAAKAAGVGRIVYTSILKADRSPLMIASDHRATEEILAGAGIATTILRNNWYSENRAATLPAALGAGALIGAAGQAPFNTATRADLGQALAIAAADAALAGAVLELAGDETYTLADLAAEAQRQSGRDLPYRDLSPEEYQAALLAAGLPAGFAAVLVDADVQARDGWMADDSGALSRLLGRPTTPIADVVAAALA
ncbi:NAD(P)H-binding protein [Plastorhodobacter daqingensis]|uniref:NAD(P)H-binding protein n=1 Tax=Plastorhodobacter daqingensis TaxID=1387281 RepID=A0ABW2UPU5_9RHOB